MDGYRRMWTCLVAVAGTVGLWAALLVWSIGGTVFFFLFTVITVACVRLLMTKEGERPQWRRAWWAGFAGAAAVVPAAGLLARFGGPGLAAVTVLTLSAPSVLTKAKAGHRALRHSTEPVRGHPRAPGSDLPTSTGGEATDLTAATAFSLLETAWLKTPAHSMDNDTLCFAWRTSYVALQLALPPSSKLRIVDKRREFLDELELRNPDGFSAWLASGARAAGDPSRYLSSTERHTRRRDQR